MLRRFYEGCDSKSTAMKIYRVYDLVSMRYSSIRKDISLYNERVSKVIDQLKS